MIQRALPWTPWLPGTLMILGMTLIWPFHWVKAATSEQALIAAYLYNFLKFTEWPASSVGDQLTLCVASAADLGKDIDAIGGRAAQNKTVKVKHVDLNESLNVCQILFLPREEKPVRLREWLKNIEKWPVLVVSNNEDFLDMGGMIVLINDGSRLQFEVDLTRVDSVGLKLNSQLLKIAREVRGNTP